MIVVFHSLYFIVRYLAKVYRVSREARKSAGCHLVGSEVIFQSSITVDDAFTVHFDPPLFKQRYATVQQILLNERYRPRIRKIVEFGCGELNFFIYMKHLFGISEILCVDADEDVLVDNKHRVRPLHVDFLKKRSQKLTVQLLCGSVSDPDHRLRGADAVVAIELIEHLYPDTLEALPYNIFGFVRPLVVIFTTPNAEFNVIFGRDGFRHIDHKFEWNREQFQDWCTNVTERFPNYNVYFDGVGPGPDDKRHLGHCTQYAVFLREVDEEVGGSPPAEPVGATDESFGVCTHYSYTRQVRIYEEFSAPQASGAYYRPIDAVDYPFEVDDRSPEKRILDEVLYKIYSMATPYSRFYNEDLDRVECPLYVLISNEEGCFTTVSEVKTLLQRENFTVEECAPRGHDERTPCVIYDLATMENKSPSPSPGSDGSSSDEKALKIPWALTALDDTDWDTEYSPAVRVSTIPNKEKVDDGQFTSADSTLVSAKAEDEVVAMQYHGTIPERERPGGTSEKKPKKGTNIKNRHQPSTSDAQRSAEAKKKQTAARVTESVRINRKVSDKDSSQSSSQDSSSNRNVKTVRSSLKTSTKTKLISSPKRSPKIEDSMASTSDAKKKRKKKADESRDDMKNLFECIVYNTLNSIPTADDANAEEAPLPNTSANAIIPDIKDLMEKGPVSSLNNPADGNGIAEGVIDDVLNSVYSGDNDSKANDCEQGGQQAAADGTSRELNMASREALFDPNSEIDMLEEFGIPPETDAQEAVPASQHHNVILIGLNLNNDEEGGVVIPESTDPFPNWLLQLLGANVEEAGESHDEPHFYCQGDGIGVHPSIIEVEIDDDDESSDSTSSNDEAEAERTISESVVGPLPSDELEPSEPLETTAGRYNTATPGSATESADEYYDTIDEHTTYATDSSKNTNDFSDV